MARLRFAVRKTGPRIPLAREPAWSPCWPTIRARRRLRRLAARLAAHQTVDR